MVMSSPASSAASTAHWSCARTFSRAVADWMEGVPLLVGTYALTMTISVPSSRTRMRARCTLPSTSVVTSDISTVSVFHQMRTPAYASPLAAGDAATRHPWYSPEVSSCWTRSPSPLVSDAGM